MVPNTAVRQIQVVVNKERGGNFFVIPIATSEAK
jgi:hypothetical protein